MPTIKDIASLAGVSYGTVSNVLNKKSNVSASKIHKVEMAAKKLGYVSNVQAQNLRKGHSNKICIVVPNFTNIRYANLATGIMETIRNPEYEVACYASDNDCAKEQSILEHLLPEKPMAIVLSTCATKTITNRFKDIPLYLADRKAKVIDDPAFFFGFDYGSIGKEMARRAINDGGRSIALFCGDNAYSDNRDFNLGITNMLVASGISFQEFPYKLGVELRTAFTLCSSSVSFDAVITPNMHTAMAVKQAFLFNPELACPKIYCISSLESHDETAQIISYHLNYKYCGRIIAKHILHSDFSGIDTSYCVPDGFAEHQKLVRRHTDKTQLKFLTLPGPMTEALKMMLPQLQAKTGIHVILDERSSEEIMLQLQRDDEDLSTYDFLRIDMAMLQDFGPKIYRPINLGTEPYRTIIGDLDAQISREFIYVNDTAFALPLDISVQMLFYRKDLFEDTLIKRQYKEKTGRELTIPSTYEEYDAIAKFFTRSINPESPTLYGTASSYSTPMMAICDIRPRLNALGWEPEQDNPIGDAALLAKGLTDYYDTSRINWRNTDKWWQETMQSFTSERVAMVSIFSNYASELISLDSSEMNGKIGFAPLPCRMPLLGGGVIGIGSRSIHKEEAEQFLSWLYASETSSVITKLGGFIDNKKIYENMDILNLYPWLELVRLSLERDEER